MSTDKAHHTHWQSVLSIPGILLFLGSLQRRFLCSVQIFFSSRIHRPTLDFKNNSNSALDYPTIKIFVVFDGDMRTVLPNAGPQRTGYYFAVNLAEVAYIV